MGNLHDDYVTVAVGRDYGDVAPTSGTYRAPFLGRLSARKHAGLTAVEYFPNGTRAPAPPAPANRPPWRQ